MKPWMPSSVCAQTIAMSARLPLVIHIFEPLITQSPPSLLRMRLHVGRIGAAMRFGQTEAADHFARAMRGSHFLRCSSVP
jgi:hypothetical protein